jgi:hypothetical protein
LDRCYDFLIIFAEKFSEKIGVFDSKQSQILKKMIITLVFKKTANIFVENWGKSQKIALITSTPGRNGVRESAKIFVTNTGTPMLIHIVERAVLPDGIFANRKPKFG